jgi:hypothetical protein
MVAAETVVTRWEKDISPGAKTAKDTIHRNREKEVVTVVWRMGTYLSLTK